MSYTIKRFALLLAVMTLFTTSSAHADLFPSLHPGQTTSTTHSEEAPSFSSFADVDYDDAQPYGESGQTVYSYKNVTEEKYIAFGNYLEGMGFRTTAAEVNGATVQMMITDGHFNLGVAYYGDLRELLVIYDAGVVPAGKSLFPGYTRLRMNEEITIKNLGRFTFTELRLNGPKVKTVGYYSTYSKEYSRTTPVADYLTCLTFTYFNTKTADTKYWWNGKVSQANDLLDVRIIYINEDNQYTYAQERYGSYADGIIYCDKTAPIRTISAQSTAPLTLLNAGVVFGLPEAVRTATDGTLALLLDFKTGEKYYIPIRENGVALY